MTIDHAACECCGSARVPIYWEFRAAVCIRCARQPPLWFLLQQVKVGAK